jgi:hypothetical protein
MCLLDNGTGSLLFALSVIFGTPLLYASLSIALDLDMY